MPASKLQIPLGGLWIQCFGVQELLASEEDHKEAVVLFFLHGRFGSAERIEHLVHKTYDDAVALATRDTTISVTDALSAVSKTFDQRNHGTRKISHKGQLSWSEGNIEHAQGMLAMQRGTASDVSFLADFLPSHLFPNDEATVTKLAVTGISLGGHSVWIVLREDPRFDIGIPMLGCPSYRSLMKQRADAGNLPYAPPYMPNSLLDLLSRVDPDAADYANLSKEANPFIGKKILVLHGEKDELVPWQCCKEFADGLQVGESGRKEIIIEAGRGHETSAFMIGELVKWIVKYGMKE